MKKVLLVALALFVVGAMLRSSKSSTGSSSSYNSTGSSYGGAVRPVARDNSNDQRMREWQYQIHMQNVENEYRNSIRKINDDERKWNEQKRQMDSGSR